MAQKNIYHSFVGTNDILKGNEQTITTGIFTNDDGTLDGFYTSSTELALSSSYYYINVYQTESSENIAEVQFSLAYGNYDGFYSSSAYDLTYDPSQVNYLAYINKLTSRDIDQFIFAGGVSSSEAYFVSFNRQLLKDQINVKSLQLDISGSSTAHITVDTSTTETLVDSTYYLSDTVRYLVSGTYNNGIVESASTHPYGVILPEEGLMIFNADYLSSSIGFVPSSSANNSRDINIDFYDALAGGNNFRARDEEIVSSTHYFCRIYHNEFNLTNNSTWYSSSDDPYRPYPYVTRYEDMIDDPIVYITTIGLYDDSDQLLAVAKLSQPLQKSFNQEALIKVKIDY